MVKIRPIKVEEKCLPLGYPVCFMGSVLVGPQSTLSPRQTQVWKALARGETNKEIALNIGRSVKTVEYHVSCLKYRLHCFDIARLTRLALKIGLVKLADE